MPSNSVNVVSALNLITKDIYDSRQLDLIAPRKNTLYNLLKGRGNVKDISTEGALEFFVADSYNYSVVPGGRNVTIPNGQNHVSGTKARIGIKQFYANAEITAHDIEFQQNNAVTYINVVDRALKDLIIGREYWLSCAALGNGSGQVAKVGTDASAIAAGSSGTVSFNNTYLDMGWDGVSLLRNGAIYDVYRGSTPYGPVLVTSPVQSRTPGVRTGTAVLTNIGSSSWTPTAGDILYLPGTYGVGIPMGLRGIINPGFATNPLYGIDGDNQFQGQYKGDVTNTTAVYRKDPEAALFRSKIWRSKKADAAAGTADFGCITDGDETFTGATLQDWDAGTLREIISDVEYQSNNPNKVDCLLCNVFMAEKMWSIAENRVDMTSTWVSELGNEFVNLFDIRQVGAFVRSDGTKIPVIVDEWIPNNEIIGLTSQDLIVCTHGNFDFMRRLGDIWEPTFSNGLDNYQAPYKGYINFGAYRCDGCFSIQGLKSIND